MNDPRRALHAFGGIAAGLTLLLLSACGGPQTDSGTRITGGATATPALTAPAQPPATTPQAAVGIVQQWAAAKAHADVNFVEPELPPIEEGPALEMDTAQYEAYVTGVGRYVPPPTIPPFTVSNITAVVPQNGAYPASFLAEATFHSSAGGGGYLLVFAKDDAGSPWKAAAYLQAPSGVSFPRFVLNAQGYGATLDAATMQGYPATVMGVAGAYCNYLGGSFGTTKQVPNAPAITFVAGPYTSAELTSGTASTNAIRHGGGTSDGTYAPEPYAWAYQLADGSAFAIATVQSTLDQAAGPSSQLSVPAIYPFVTAGAYSTSTQASEGTFGIVEPASGTTASVTMQYIQFTKEQAT